MNKIIIRKELYIEILKYANNRSSFTADELVKDLLLNPDEEKILNDTILFDDYKSFFFRNTATIPMIYTISVKGRFSLLEYEKLEDARESSKIAITIAIAALIVTIITSLWSIFSSIKINDNQFNQLINKEQTIHAK